MRRRRGDSAEARPNIIIGVPSISTVGDKPSRKIVPPILTTDWTAPAYASNVLASERIIIIGFIAIPISVRHGLPVTDPMAFGLSLGRSRKSEPGRRAERQTGQIQIVIDDRHRRDGEMRTFFFTSGVRQILRLRFLPACRSLRTTQHHRILYHRILQPEHWRRGFHQRCRCTRTPDPGLHMRLHIHPSVSPPP